MDSLITAAALALASGDVLGALNRIALREDAPALALRGIAMARLGDFGRAKTLLRQAARSFAPSEAVARARCTLAEAEIALASRDLRWPARALDAARAVLDKHGDTLNAAHARSLAIRRLLLIGQLDDAETQLAALDPAPLPPPSRAIYELIVAGLAIRRLQTQAARAALERAEHAARRAGIDELMAEVEQALATLSAPAAQLLARRKTRLLRLAEVEALLRSEVLVVDACRLAIRRGHDVIALARRPVLFALARALAEAWPNDVPRATLIALAFRGKEADDSHRARLRVEIGRLRQAMRPLAEVSATRTGFVLSPTGAEDVAVLTPPIADDNATVLACLADGEAWSSSALALALGESQRSVQRALDELQLAGKVQGVGRGRARRWTSPLLPGFATALLLPTMLPAD